MIDILDKRKIAASAELLRERIQNGHTGDGQVHGPTATGGFDESELADLRKHTDVDDVEAYASFGKWPDDEQLPEWVGTFESIIEYLYAVDDSTSLSVDFEETYPFVEILYRVVEYSSRTFVDDVDTGSLSEKAFRNLQERLMNRLAHEAGMALHMDYTEYVQTHGSIGDSDLSPDSTRWYDEYTAAFFDGRAVAFFERFPALARVIAIMTRQWESHVSRFLSRLNDDYDSIRSVIGTDELGGIASVEDGAGDIHDDGESVVVVEFESGDEIVYKPRSVEPARELYGFEDWLHEELDDFPELQTPEVLDRSTYGWIEKVELGTFSDVSEIGEYYERAGALLCVLYVLDTADIHFQNLIAADTSLVVVDAETIMHTNVTISETSDANTNEKIRESVTRSSVLKTDMLPYRMEDGGNSRSGLAMMEVRESDAYTVTWKHANTDAIAFAYEHPSTEPEKNYPSYDGEPAAPYLFLDEIVSGFETAYDAMMGSRDAVTRRIEERFGGIRVRQILQNTGLYRALIKTLSNPEYLRNGVKQDVKIRKTLAEKWDGSEFVEQPDENILRAEGEALFRRDVPRFYLMSDTDELYLEGQKVATGFFQKSGIERVREKVAGMSEENRDYQKGLIRASLDDFSSGWGPDGGESR
jgi:type 2 lantibiotic biosynthesis protein LanM